MRLYKEWSTYSQTRLPLRVTSPKGNQKSMQTLQLPWKYSVPLIAVMVILHWLISQSIFLTLINLYDYSGNLLVDRGLTTSGLGWSPYGITLSLVVSGFLLVGLWMYAFFLRYPDGMLVVGSSSAAISAACHRPVWDTSASREKIKWGVVSVDTTSGLGHAAFSSGDVKELVSGSLYR